MRINFRKYGAALLLCMAALGNQTSFGAIAHWQTDFNRAKKQAIAESKPLVAMFTASWCGPCRRMKSTTLVDRAVRQLLNSHFVTVMVDTDRNPGLTRQYNITGMPTVVIIDPTTGKSDRVRGYQGRSQFLSFLNSHKRQLQLASAVSDEKHADSPKKYKDRGLLSPYSLVSIVDRGELVKGNPSFSTKRHGYTVQFASAKEKQTFLANPDKYWPQFDGACPVMLATAHQSTLGKARWAVEYDGKLFFCHSKEHALEFIESPEKFATQDVATLQGETAKR